MRPDVIGISVRNIDDQNMNSPQFLLANIKNVVAVCRDDIPGSYRAGWGGLQHLP